MPKMIHEIVYSMSIMIIIKKHERKESGRILNVKWTTDDMIWSTQQLDQI